MGSTSKIDCLDYSKSLNPPVLHRKEAFLQPNDPRFQKFARLTQHEEKNGLLEDTNLIGKRDGWRSRLEERGFTLRGHRLVRLKQRGGPLETDEDVAKSPRDELSY
jgi:hypothetical protein